MDLLPLGVGTARTPQRYLSIGTKPERGVLRRVAKEWEPASLGEVLPCEVERTVRIVVEREKQEGGDIAGQREEVIVPNNVMMSTVLVRLPKTPDGAAH